MFRYVEPLSDARTPLADFFSILLDDLSGAHQHSEGNSLLHRFLLFEETQRES
jgi:hypothetical protein